MNGRPLRLSHDGKESSKTWLDRKNKKKAEGPEKK